MISETTMKDNEELVEVVSDCEPLLVQERKHNIGLLSLKILSGVFLVGCVCYLFLGISGDLPSAQENENEVSDLSVGKWIPNPAGPQYTNETCNHIQSYTNCLNNGRPDRGYLYWRWKPSACDLPPFNPVKFLNAMSDKSWAFIGDSILSNHVYSFICLLSKVEEPHEIHHDSTYKTRTWYYPFHNFTLYVIWAPYLVFYETAGKHGDASETNINELHLDMLDSQWTKEYHKFDYVVLSGSQWFYKSSIMIEDNQVIGCHNCPYKNLRELGVEETYRKALQLSLKFIATSVHKPFVILRTWNPSHYESGDWANERICNRSEPFKEGEINGDPTDLKMRNIEIEEFQKAAGIGARNGVQMKVLDTYHLSLLRPDGHPGPYGKYHPFDGDDKKNNVENDCIHWCLPGPIDSWNDLLMKMVIDDDDDARDPASGLF
ncbi:hypothetical protein J5N97_019669 [Dioscorea zingiberensis]|uniref:Trichome birefringence-like N-terminal domain-containing protein n=1 Tax=Dioscorea zingiberensis TaxID=325984 RepID=A0A9D5CGF5_9LILI|nr:hypothetical protein J5N97_019669 [Dioscorea zingiberensis]